MYPCDKCGKCCENIGGHPLYAELDNGEGTCTFWDSVTNLCGIYSNRPLKCRVDEAYEAFFKDFMSEKDYYSINLRACKILKKQEE
jgi:Fe-S-cluster containining protein